jgi:hypothetical protein
MDEIEIFDTVEIKELEFPATEHFVRLSDHAKEIAELKADNQLLTDELAIRRFEAKIVSEELGLPEATTVDEIVAAFGRFKARLAEKEKAHQVELKAMKEERIAGERWIHNRRRKV